MVKTIKIVKNKTIAEYAYISRGDQGSSAHVVGDQVYIDGNLNLFGYGFDKDGATGNADDVEALIRLTVADGQVREYVYDDGRVPLTEAQHKDIDNHQDMMAKRMTWD